ncbi:MAG: hypothetical protein QNJ06_04600 [Kiloniellales bacterium]|nr:hypothetical protein [Kiloniellales bacterium]MDJ0981704.1 hypothetical protein [Kiloniellales bacterium]
MVSKEAHVLWVVPETETADLASAAISAGGKTEVPEFWVPGEDALDEYGDQMEPLMAVALIVSTGWLIGRLSDALLDHRRPQSQLVDMRAVPAVVRTAPHVKPPGTLVILQNVGGQDVKEVYPPERRDEALAMLPKLFN